MSKTVMMAFRLPVEFKDELIRLQNKHGFSSQAMVIMEAVRHFDDVPVNVPVNDHAALADRMGALESQLTALNNRVTAIEHATNSRVVPAIKSRSQSDNDVPTDKDDALLWAAELIRSGASLKEVNSALFAKGFVGKNPSRLKDKLISLGLIDNDGGGGGGGGDELQTELTVKSQDCE